MHIFTINAYFVISIQRFFYERNKNLHKIGGSGDFLPHRMFAKFTVPHTSPQQAARFEVIIITSYLYANTSGLSNSDRSARKHR